MDLDFTKFLLYCKKGSKDNLEKFRKIFQKSEKFCSRFNINFEGWDKLRNYLTPKSLFRILHIHKLQQRQQCTTYHAQAVIGEQKNAKGEGKNFTGHHYGTSLWIWVLSLLFKFLFIEQCPVRTVYKIACSYLFKRSNKNIDNEN